MGRADPLCQAHSVSAFEKQNSDNGMALKLIQYLYTGTLEGGFAQL